MRYLGCSLPSGLVLQVLQWCCTSLRRYNRAAGLLLLLGLRAGIAILRDTQGFRNAPAPPGHFWCSMAEHGLHKTLYNELLPYNQPKLREQPLLQLGVHPWRNLIPGFLLSAVFSSIIPAERAGLVNMLSRKGDHVFEGHWPSLLVLVSCSKQESSSMWTTRRWEGILGLLDLLLNLCVALETEMPEEGALAL